MSRQKKLDNIIITNHFTKKNIKKFLVYINIPIIVIIDESTLVKK